ncbi:S-layer homology domain-containing protein [Ureibacillus sp. GCM10028918]|uniref:S-layer homology domain-containing protein n=1 Tax=Ureibacillus sp. GCM10028918 TaxID=3273429 RepID=UPI003614586E
MTKQNKGRKLFATTATAALVASAIVPVASAAVLNDIDSVPSWAKDAVQKLADNGVLEGDTKGNFNPSGIVTRAQAAQIFYKELGLTAEGSENFSDVEPGQWWYQAVVATSPELFEGRGNGAFAPKAELTRAEAAKVIVAAYGLTGSADLSTFDDASSVKAWAQDAFSAAVANGVINGKGTKLAPNDSITRAEFATMVARASESAVATGVESVTAINSTTVEVDFEDAIEDINTIGFAIEGLTVTNAVVKQTDSSVAVLTTSAQEGGKEYTVTNAGEKLGTFEGVSAVLPTAVKTTVASQQGIIGKEVTLSAEVTVASGQSKAGIPVTFNITNNAKNNETIEVEALTNAEGIASYSYTRYYDGTDSVASYATDKSSVKDSAKVYWSDEALLTIKSDTEKTELDNADSVEYTVNSSTGADFAFVAFKENLNVDIEDVKENAYVTDALGFSSDDNELDLDVDGDSLNDDSQYTYIDGKVTKELSGADVFPYLEDADDYQLVVVKLDSKGEGSFTVTGENADKVTPIVYLPETDSGIWTKTALQAEATGVSFDNEQDMTLTLEAKGVERAAAVDGLDSESAIEARYDGDDYNIGGRSYTAKLVDEDKDAVDGTKVSVVVPKDKLSKGTDKEVWLIDENAKTAEDAVTKVEADKPITLTTNNSGAVNFRLVGEESAFATPTVYYDNGDDKGELDSDDLQATDERVVFDDAEFGAAEAYIEDKNGNTVTALPVGEEGTVYYESVDQNGNLYVDGSVEGKEASFIIKAEKGSVEVDGDTVAVDESVTIKPKFSKAGVASVTIKATDDAEVSIKLSSKDPKIASKSLSLEFDGRLLTVPASHTDVLTKAGQIDTDENTITFEGYREIEYSTSNITNESNGSVEHLTSSQFETLITNGLAAGKEFKIKAVKNDDGKYTITVKTVTNGGVTTPETGVTQSVLDEVNIIGETTKSVTETKVALRSVSKFAALSDANQTTVAKAISENAPFASITALENALKAQYDLLDATTAADKALNDAKAAAATYTVAVLADYTTTTATALTDALKLTETTTQNKVDKAAAINKAIAELKPATLVSVDDLELTFTPLVEGADVAFDVLSAVYTVKADGTTPTGTTVGEAVKDSNILTVVENQTEADGDTIKVSGKANGESFTLTLEYDADTTSWKSVPVTP